jgi:hypothetical protein
MTQPQPFTSRLWIVPEMTKVRFLLGVTIGSGLKRVLPVVFQSNSIAANDISCSDGVFLNIVQCNHGQQRVISHP